MQQAYDIAMILKWPFLAIGLFGAAVAYVIARQFSAGREEMRTLRVALERSPTQAQLGQGMQLWPEAAQYPETVRLGEMIKRAHQDESRRAEKAEMSLGVCRSFVGLAVVGVALVILGATWKPAPPAPPAPQSVEGEP